MITGQGGTFSFSPLKAGMYTVREVLKSGWKQSITGQEFQFLIGTGTSVTANLGNFQIPGSIDIRLFNDLNGNNTLESGEAGLAGRLVYFDSNNNGILDPGETSASTGDGGANFDGLAPGLYRVRQTTLVGWGFSGPLELDVTIASGQTATVYFGQFQPETISGFVYKDANHNAVPDSTESHLAGWVVYLDANNNGAMDSAKLARRHLPSVSSHFHP